MEIAKSPAGDRKLTLRRICIAFVPLAALIGMIILGVTVFGRDVGDGARKKVARWICELD